VVDFDPQPMKTEFFRNSIFFFAYVILALASGQLRAGSWTGTLQDGSVLKVDPGSRRAMRYYDGGAAPLWDGTHRLENGSVVIVRDGQAVPTESMLNTWTAEPGAEPSLREHYCEQLVRKVCGFEAECGRAQPCILARQLLRIERDQQRHAPIGSGPWPQTESSSECRDALSSSSFPACSASVPTSKETACKKLVSKVCGANGECNSATACGPARQLLQMENDERLESADPNALTHTGAECQKAMDNAFFKPCP
jgi:hypothetical protein